MLLLEGLSVGNKTLCPPRQQPCKFLVTINNFTDICVFNVMHHDLRVIRSAEQITLGQAKGNFSLFCSLNMFKQLCELTDWHSLSTQHRQSR